LSDVDSERYAERENVPDDRRSRNPRMDGRQGWVSKQGIVDEQGRDDRPEENSEVQCYGDELADDDGPQDGSSDFHEDFVVVVEIDHRTTLSIGGTRFIEK
jgi:hypothetical protein